MAARPVHILFDAQRLFGTRTGVSYYTSGIIRALAENYPSELQLTGYHSPRFQPSPIVPTAPNIFYRRVWLPVKIINLLRRVRVPVPVELLTRQRADFILYPNFLGLPSITRTPSAAVIHDLTFVDLPDYVSARNLHDLRTFIPGQVKRSRFVITVSEFARRRIHETLDCPMGKVLVTPVPAAIPTLYGKSERKAILHGLGISGKFFLTLSTVEPRKNVLGMLNAYIRLPEAVQKEYAFVIAGSMGWNCSEESARLQSLIEQGRNILHLGYITEEQKSALYQEAVFYTSASHYEGFGMTLLEAMSYGKACAVSDIPVFKEVTGSDALYFDQNRSEAIAKVWLELLSNPAVRKRVAEAGKRRTNTYQWSDVAESLYNRIIQSLEETK